MTNLLMIVAMISLVVLWNDCSIDNIWKKRSFDMYELITEKTLAEYEAFISNHPKGHFAQSSLWGKQKAAWTGRAVADVYKRQANSRPFGQKWNAMPPLSRCSLMFGTWIWVR